MKWQRQWLPCVLAIAALGSGTVARCQESRRLRPEVELLVHSVSEKLEAAADALKLTPEQRTKIKGVIESFKGERTALRDQRRALLESDLKAIDEFLTPEQRTIVNNIVEDKIDDRPQPDGAVAWLRDDMLRDTLAQKLQAVADKIELTPDQKAKIRDRAAGSAEKYRGQRRARRDLVEAEFKAIAEVLTPKQREQAREYIEHRVVAAEVIQTVSDRVHSLADKLGLTAEQRKRIAETSDVFEPKFEALADERRELMQAEMKAVSGILTPEQREKVRDYLRDRMIVIKVKLDPQSIAHLKETITERLEFAADKLDLTREQRNQLKARTADFAEKYMPQRNQREALRHEEFTALGAILMPEQRETVKKLTADHVIAP